MRTINKTETVAALKNEQIIVSDEDRANIAAGLSTLERYAAQYAELKGFTIVTQSDLIARLLHLCEEAGELAAAHREGNPAAEQLPGFQNGEEEAADVLAVLLMIVSGTGCRLRDAFISKLESCSVTRGHLHGKSW